MKPSRSYLPIRSPDVKPCIFIFFWFEIVMTDVVVAVVVIILSDILYCIVKSFYLYL